MHLFEKEKQRSKWFESQEWSHLPFYLMNFPGKCEKEGMNWFFLHWVLIPKVILWNEHLNKPSISTVLRNSMVFVQKDPNVRLPLPLRLSRTLKEVRLVGYIHWEMIFLSLIQCLSSSAICSENVDKFFFFFFLCLIC